MPMELQGMTHINLIMMGVITPTAALSAFPFTPVESMKFYIFCMMKIELIMLVLLDLTMLFSSQLGYSSLFSNRSRNNCPDDRKL
jgi:hypothetical protein